MSGLSAAWLLALKRIGAHKRMSLGVALGILLAAVVLAFIPSYERAMADIGLRFNIRERAGDEAYLQAFTGNVSAGPEVNALERRVNESISGRAGWFVSPVDVFLRTRGFAGTFGDNQRLSVTLNGLRSMESRVSVVEGRFPNAEALEVAVTPRIAERLGLALGDQVGLTLGLTNCFPPPPPPPGLGPPPVALPCLDELSSATALSFTVVGLIEPLDPEDPLLATIGADPNRVPRTDADGDIYPLVVAYPLLRGEFASAMPTLSVSANWVYQADLAAVQSSTAVEARKRLLALQEDLRKVNVYTISSVADALEQFRQSQSFSRAPILILAFQIAGVVIIYVGIVSALLAEELVEETSLLRGRGASLPQVFGLAALEGLTYAIPAALIAPFLAAAAVTVLGYTPLFDEATGNAALPFSLTASAFLYAVGGALLATGAMALPVAISARRRLQEGRRRQARGTGRPIYQRYFLDAGVVVVAVILIFQLQRQETVFEPNSLGGLSGDPLLLFAPSIFSLAAVAILLRFFPLGLRLVAKVIRPIAGPAGELALTNLSRATPAYARLTVLLMLVFALGAFAATYSPTVDTSHRERKEYEVGPPLRISNLGQLESRSADEVREVVEKTDGVASAMTVYRGEGGIGHNTRVGSTFAVLALEASQAAGFVEWREDFAPGHQPQELLPTLASGSSVGGITFPGQPEVLAIDAEGGCRTATTLWLVVRDAAANYHMVDMGKLSCETWTEHSFRVADSASIGREPAYPLTLVSILLTEPENSFSTSQRPVYLDKLRSAEGGTETVVESFEGPLRWAKFSADPNSQDKVSTAALQSARDGTNVLQYNVVVGRSAGKRGLYVTSPSKPVPALVSTVLAGLMGVGRGSVTEISLRGGNVQIVVGEVIEFFPTLDEPERGFVVMDIEALFAWTRAVRDEPTRATEAWATVEPGADPAEVVARLRSDAHVGFVFDRAEELRLVTTNPVIAAGASGLLGAGFVAALSVLGLALVLSLLLDAERRTVTTSVLRAVGMGRRTVFGALAIEYGVVVVVGSVLGAVMGLQVSALMLRFLDVTEQGERVIPPFALATDWTALGIAALALLVVATVGVVAAGTYLVRASVPQAIRISE